MDTKEILAKFFHEKSWAHWMKHQFTQTTKMYRSVGHSDVQPEPYYSNDEDEFEVAVIETEQLKRWERQMNTLYENLSEKEKDSDREIVDTFNKYLKEKGYKIVKVIPYKVCSCRNHYFHKECDDTCKECGDKENMMNYV